MSFPTTLPTYTITSGNDTLNTTGGSGLSPTLNSIEADVVALGTKIGTGASTPVSNAVLVGNGTGTSAWTSTLSGLTINSPTGLTKTDVGLSNVNNTSDATKNSANVTLVNKTLDGGSNTLTNISVGSISTTSGAWASWTPTFTNWTIGTGGSALVDARYTQIGKSVFFSLNSILGSSGQSVGSGISFTLPITPRITSGNGINIGSAIVTAGGVLTAGIVTLFNGSISLTAMGAGGTYVSSVLITSTQPGTWVAGDSIRVTGTYEAA